MTTHKNQAGFGYFLVILIGALILGVVVFAGYRVISSNEDQESATTTTDTSTTNIQNSEDLDQVEGAVEQSDVDGDLDTTEVDQDVDALL